MASSTYLKAVIANESDQCSFCRRNINDELNYGKQYKIGTIHCHYFCALLSCCLIQKGTDADGLLGFLYPDIISEINRSQKHKCSYCGSGGASLGCSVKKCKKQFHLPCGKEKNAVSLFYGDYKSFCVNHAPKQVIPKAIMNQAKLRLKKLKSPRKLKDTNAETSVLQKIEDAEENSTCVICYEAIMDYSSINTFWPPCCAKDVWIHRNCLKKMAMNAGKYHLKCPLCNDKKRFQEAVLKLGYYIPNRDAAWELEENAFSDMYRQSVQCKMEVCACPDGRAHDLDWGPWDIKMCVMCGGSGAHVGCLPEKGAYVCPPCGPAAAAAPDLVHKLHEMAVEDRRRLRLRERDRYYRGRVTNRMSLRRTKGLPRLAETAYRATWRRRPVNETDTAASSSGLNIDTLKKLNILVPELSDGLDNYLIAPIEMLEEGLMQRDINVMIDPKELLEKMRKMFDKPKPLTVKKRLVNTLIDELEKRMFINGCETNEPADSNIKDEDRKGIVLLKHDDNQQPNDVINEHSTPESIKSIGPDNKEVIDLATITCAERQSNATVKMSVENDIINKDFMDFIVQDPKEIVLPKHDDNQQPNDVINEHGTPEIIKTKSAYVDNEGVTDLSTIKCAKMESNTIVEMSVANDIINKDLMDVIVQDPQEFVLPNHGDKQPNEQSNTKTTKTKGPDIENEGVANLPRIKCEEIESNATIVMSAKNDMINKDVVTLQNSDSSYSDTTKCTLKFIPIIKEELEETEANLDIDSFKIKYLNEVGYENEMNTLDQGNNNSRKRKLNEIKHDVELVNKKNKRRRRSKRITMDKKKRKNISKEKNRDSSKKPKLRQSRFKFNLENSVNGITFGPEVKMAPIKRKRRRKNIKCDNLKQTSLDKYFINAV